MSAVMRLGLLKLAFRRTLPPVAGVALLVGLTLAVLAAGDRAARVSSPEAELLLRFSRRLDVWTFSIVLIAPALLVQVGRLGRADEWRWLRRSPEPHAGVAFALFLGTALALALVVVATGVAAEGAAGEGPLALRRIARRPTPSGLITSEKPSIAWSDPALRAPGASVLRLALGIAPGSGPAVGARWSATLGTVRTEVEARLGARTWLTLALPEALTEAPADARFELRRTSAEGAVLVLRPDGLEALGPVASERLSSVALAVRVWLALLVAGAWTLGLASRMRPSLAAGVPLAIGFGALARGFGREWLPAGDLLETWSAAASGLVPSWPSGASLLTGVVLVAAGLTLRVLPGGKGA